MSASAERCPLSAATDPFILSFLPFSSSRLINIISKLGTTYFAPTIERAGTNNSLPSPFPTTGPTLVGDSKINESMLAGQSQESHLKRQSLECLVAVLRSLVSWSARGNAAPTLPIPRSNSVSLPSLPEGSSNDDLVGTKSEQDLNGLLTQPASGTATPDIMSPLNAPSRFEDAKQKKTTLLEGIKKFNFKPKRVSSSYPSWSILLAPSLSLQVCMQKLI